MHKGNEIFRFFFLMGLLTWVTMFREILKSVYFASQFVRISPLPGAYAFLEGLYMGWSCWPNFTGRSVEHGRNHRDRDI